MLLADGRQKKMLLGDALFSLDGFDKTLTCPVIFGAPDSLYLLGATALETFGVDVDPTANKLKPILGIIGGHLASQ